MKINNKNKDFSTTFELLEAGDVFSYCGDIYMKASHPSLNAINLEDGGLNKFEPSTSVYYLENAELVINN
jgi:hypothetical protein